MDQPDNKKEVYLFNSTDMFPGYLYDKKTKQCFARGDEKVFDISEHSDNYRVKHCNMDALMKLIENPGKVRPTWMKDLKAEAPMDAILISGTKILEKVADNFTKHDSHHTVTSTLHKCYVDMLLTFQREVHVSLVEELLKYINAELNGYSGNSFPSLILSFSKSTFIYDKFYGKNNDRPKIKTSKHTVNEFCRLLKDSNPGTIPLSCYLAEPSSSNVTVICDGNLPQHLSGNTSKVSVDGEANVALVHNNSCDENVFCGQAENKHPPKRGRGRGRMLLSNICQFTNNSMKLESVGNKQSYSELNYLATDDRKSERSYLTSKNGNILVEEMDKPVKELTQEIRSLKVDADKIHLVNNMPYFDGRNNDTKVHVNVEKKVDEACKANLKENPDEKLKAKDKHSQGCRSAPRSNKFTINDTSIDGRSYDTKVHVEKKVDKHCKTNMKENPEEKLKENEKHCQECRSAPSSTRFLVKDKAYSDGNIQKREDQSQSQERNSSSSIRHCLQDQNILPTSKVEQGKLNEIENAICPVKTPEANTVSQQFKSAPSSTRSIVKDKTYSDGKIQNREDQSQSQERNSSSSIRHCLQDQNILPTSKVEQGKLNEIKNASCPVKTPEANTVSQQFKSAPSSTRSIVKDKTYSDGKIQKREDQSQSKEWNSSSSIRHCLQDQNILLPSKVQQGKLNEIENVSWPMKPPEASTVSQQSKSAPSSTRSIVKDKTYSDGKIQKREDQSQSKERNSSSSICNCFEDQTILLPSKVQQGKLNEIENVSWPMKPPEASTVSQQSKSAPSSTRSIVKDKTYSDGKIQKREDQSQSKEWNSPSSIRNCLEDQTILLPSKVQQGKLNEIENVSWPVKTPEASTGSQQFKSAPSSTRSIVKDKTYSDGKIQKREDQSQSKEWNSSSSIRNCLEDQTILLPSKVQQGKLNEIENVSWPVKTSEANTVPRQCKPKDKEINMTFLNPINTVNDPCGIERKYYGQINESLPEKVILLLGASGCGKSTLLNFIANYFRGKETADELIHVVTMEAPTSLITAYTFCTAEDETPITVVDTPGLNDSCGAEIRDHVQSLKIFIANASSKGFEIHAIGFVAQAHLVRLTSSERLVMDYVSTMFGERVSDHLITFVTFADSQNTPPIIEAMQNYGVNFKQFFRFNNSALSNSYSDEVDVLDRVYWKISRKQWKKCLKIVKDLPCLSVKAMKAVQSEVYAATVIESAERSLNAEMCTFLKQCYKENGISMEMEEVCKQIWQLAAVLQNLKSEKEASSCIVEHVLIHCAVEVCKALSLSPEKMVNYLSLTPSGRLVAAGSEVILTMEPMYKISKTLQPSSESLTKYEWAYCYGCENNHKLVRITNKKTLKKYLTELLWDQSESVICLKCQQCKCSGELHGASIIESISEQKILEHTMKRLHEVANSYSLPGYPVDEESFLKCLARHLGPNYAEFIQNIFNEEGKR